MVATVRRLAAKLAVIAVPADAAQRACDALQAAGIKGILNFAPANLRVPKGVAVNDVDLVVLLEQLAFQANAVP
jgi:redox-sensing transcriptional repressor